MSTWALPCAKAAVVLDARGRALGRARDHVDPFLFQHPLHCVRHREKLHLEDVTACLAHAAGRGMRCGHTMHVLLCVARRPAPGAAPPRGRDSVVST